MEKNAIVLTWALLALCTTCRAGEAWQSLFDGKALDGWTRRGGKHDFQAVDGAIVGTTVPGEPNGFLCTDKHYADFILELEFKVDATLNSGVQIRSHSLPAYRKGRVHGYQVEIDPSARAWSAGIYDESRRGWLNDLKANEPARKAFKAAQWNALRVVAKGDSIKTWLNGVPAADLTDAMTAGGFIGLQVHGYRGEKPVQVRWRNLRIQDLGNPVLATVTVAAGKSERADTPVSAALPKGLDPAKPVRLVELVPSGQGRLLKAAARRCQVLPGSPATLCWVLTGTTAPGAERTFRLLAAEGEPAEVGGGVRAQLDGEKGVDISLARSPTKVLRYHCAPVPPPAGQSKLYTRSGFIHPLHSPSGAVLTAIHPADHIHHMGVWMPWTRTEFEGRKVDFWNLKAGQGTVRFTRLASRSSGAVVGGFAAVQEHVNLTAPGGEKVALDETLDVRVWDLGGPRKGHLIDYSSTQRCASTSPLLLKKYRYGGFGFRGSNMWTDGKADYLTSEGKTRADGHGTRARWCILHGPTANGPAGVLVMSHPGNHEHPEPVRIWPKGGIFFNFCPIQKADWTLEPGRDYRLQYRLYAYDGKLTAEAAERLWQDFAHPPKVTVE